MNSKEILEVISNPEANLDLPFEWREKWYLLLMPLSPDELVEVTRSCFAIMGNRIANNGEIGTNVSLETAEHATRKAVEAFYQSINLEETDGD